VSYNASVVKIYNAMSSLVYSENKKYVLQLCTTLCTTLYTAGVIVVNSGANPTTVNYNASVAKIYIATSSLLRFEKKISSAL
jgi:hypothetical protein